MPSITFLTAPFKSLRTAYHPHWEEEAFTFQAQALRASSRHVQNKDQGAQAQDWEVAEGAEDEAVESREDRIVEVIRDNGEAYLSLCVPEDLPPGDPLLQLHQTHRFWPYQLCSSFHHHFPISNHILPISMSAPLDSGALQSAEYAGQAFASLSLHSTLPELSNHLFWTADTGATSHMMPHKHWLQLHNYTPMRITVRLANNQIIYSEGVGSVLLAPEVQGKLVQQVEFTRVLHVPRLGSNLLSVLFLARQCSFDIHLSSERMDFIRNGQTLFCAPIQASNTAF